MASVQDGKTEIVSGPDGAAARAAVESARKLLSSGDADAAAAALRNFATRDEAPPAELADAAKILFDAGAPVEAVGRYLESGRGFLAAGDHGRARQNFAAAYEIDGKNMDALFGLGRVDVAEGKKHDGLDKFVEILRKSNLKHLPALYEAGCLYEQDGQHNQAILAFKRVVEKDKGHIAALEHLGTLHKVRNQLPESADYFGRAADAAHVQLHNEDAKRLAQLAISIDPANATARRVLSEAEKSVAPPSKTEEAPAPQKTAPTGKASTGTAVTGVSSPNPPMADSPVPPPPPSTLSIGLPTDVALLEQQSQAMAQLAQVQNAVAQTYRQRIALEEEIRQAQAALEALQREQQSVDEDLSGRRDELAKVVAERENEEAALAALGDAIAKSRSELDALSDLPALVAQIKSKCAQVADLASKTAADVNAVQSQSEGVRAKAASADASVAELSQRLSAAKAAAEALDRQLTDANSAAKGVRSAADEATSGAAQVKAAIDALAVKRQALEAATGELSTTSNTVGQKQAEAAAALARLGALQAQRKTQFEEIIFKLPPLAAEAPKPEPARAAAEAPKPEPARPAADAPKAGPARPAAEAPKAEAKAGPAPAAKSAPANAPGQAPVENAGGPPVDALIAAGKFGDAVQRAQTEANAQPKPADYLVDVGDRLRAAGKVEEASKLYAAARDRDQASARARYELGSAFVDLGRLDEALGMLQSVEAAPEYAVLGQVAIGRCLRRKGDLDAAEARFSKALEIEGRPETDYHQALYQLAELHESKGDPDSLGLALWSFEELQTSNPDYGDVAQRVQKLKAQLADAGTRTEPKRNGAVK
jgi:tetratricopeptide (TPR) repeat protein